MRLMLIKNGKKKKKPFYSIEKKLKFCDGIFNQTSIYITQNKKEIYHNHLNGIFYYIIK